LVPPFLFVSLGMEVNKKIGLKNFRVLLEGSIVEVGSTVNVKGNLFRFSDKIKDGARVRFISYGSDRFEEVYRNVVIKLNEVDGGGWSVEDKGSWYGDGSGWCVVKVYKNN
jgi:hypothetical protein